MLCGCVISPVHAENEKSLAQDGLNRLCGLVIGQLVMQ